MSKNKIAKLLLALGIGAVTAASGLAVTACAPAGDPNGGQQAEQTTYHVTFNMNHADTSGAPAAKDTNSEGKVTEPTTPGARSDGQVFDGWWTEATGGTKFDFDTKITQDTTLYAHWKTAGTGGTGGGEGEQPGGGGGTGGEQPADPSTAPTVKLWVGGGSVTLPATSLEKGADDKWHFTSEALSDSGKLPSTVLGELVKSGMEFDKWFADATYSTEFDFTAAVEVATLNIYARVYENVDIEFKPAGAAGAVLTENLTQGIFTVVTNGKTKYETKGSGSLGINTQGSTILVKPTGVTNTISFNAYSGSSGNALTVHIKKITTDGSGAETKTEVAPVEETTTWKTAPNDNNGANFTVSNLEAGTYEISGTKATGESASLGVRDLKVTSKLPVGKVTGLEISGGTRDFLLGDEFSSEGMTVYLCYDNGRKDSLPNGYTFNASAFTGATAAGEYDVTCTYRDANNDEFTGTFKITAYTIKSVKIITNDLLNYTPQVYTAGSKFDASNISVMAVGTNAGVDKEFYNVPSTLVELTNSAESELTNLTAGVKTITAKAWDGSAFSNTISDTVSYYVIPALPAKTAIVFAEIAPSADTALTGDKIGTLKESGQANSESNPYQFKTVQQAIDFFNAMNLDEAVTKYIKLGAGTYKEKLYVDIPNLVIVGAGVVESGTDTPIGTEAPSVPNSDSKTWQWKSTISYDAIMNKPDGAGNLWNSDNSATIYITAAAKNFMMNSVAVVNENNTAEKVNAHAGDDQALALYSEADQSVYQMCSFSSYQDTVQLKNGRHLLVSCYIEGATDFIYGDNSTSYFYKCQIHCLDHVSNIGKESDLSQADGGYITAFKGGDGDAHVEYGAVFDWCEFTATQTEYGKGGKWAIARPWADYSSVAILNSKLGKHIAKNSALDAAKNARLSNGLLKKNIPNTVKTYEYNNSGLDNVKGSDGSFTAEEIAANNVAGITFLDDNAAKKFELIGTEFGDGEFNSECLIFKATNGTVTYANGDWGNMAPKQGAVIMVYKVGTGGEETDVLMADKVVYTTTQLDAAAIKDIAKNYVLAADEELGDVYTDRDLSTGKVEAAQELTANQTYKFYVKIDKVTGQKTDNYTYSFEELKTAVGDDGSDQTTYGQKDLTGTEFTGSNSWISVATSKPENAPSGIKGTGAKVQYRGGGKNNVLEIKGIALKVTFKGKGKLVITFGSSSKDKTSGLCVIDADGNYVTGAITGGSAVTKVDSSFTVAGTNQDDQVTFTINAAGTYYIVGDTINKQYDRNTRIYAMTMSDTYSPEA